MALRECLEMNWFKNPQQEVDEREYNPPPEGNPSFLARRNRFQTALVRFIGKRTPKCREVVRIFVTVYGFQAVAHHGESSCAYII